MGLKGYRLWVMGQLDSTCTAPPYVFAIFRRNISVPPRGPPAAIPKKPRTVSPAAMPTAHVATP
jgi:hypothetical protein